MFEITNIICWDLIGLEIKFKFFYSICDKFNSIWIFFAERWREFFKIRFDMQIYLCIYLTCSGMNNFFFLNRMLSRSIKYSGNRRFRCAGNRLHLKGTEMTSGAPTKGLNGTTGTGILTSPFFPARYPRDLGLEYVITCPTEAPSCRIRLLFSDFQLATVSIMEVQF